MNPNVEPGMLMKLQENFINLPLYDRPDRGGSEFGARALHGETLLVLAVCGSQVLLLGPSGLGWRVPEYFVPVTGNER